MRTEPWQLRNSRRDDIDALVSLEERCFEIDRISRRSFRRWLDSPNKALIIAERAGTLLGYALVILRRKKRLAWLYSIAVESSSRGTGLGCALLRASEKAALDAGRIGMCLEVRPNNEAAIRLYEKEGYHFWGRYDDYYEDHSFALRYGKHLCRDTIGQSIERG